MTPTEFLRQVKATIDSNGTRAVKGFAAASHAVNSALRSDLLEVEKLAICRECRDAVAAGLTDYGSTALYYDAVVRTRYQRLIHTFPLVKAA